METPRKGQNRPRNSNDELYLDRDCGSSAEDLPNAQDYKSQLETECGMLKRTEDDCNGIFEEERGYSWTPFTSGSSGGEIDRVMKEEDTPNTPPFSRAAQLNKNKAISQDDGQHVCRVLRGGAQRSFKSPIAQSDAHWRQDICLRSLQ